MQYLAVCTFELKGASAREYDLAYADLQGLGFRRGHAANGGGADLPADAIVGTFTSHDVGFLRNCLSLKLEEVFARRGLDAEFLVVVSRGDLAWVRGGYAAGDFAERHGRGSLVATPA